MAARNDEREIDRPLAHRMPGVPTYLRMYRDYARIGVAGLLDAVGIAHLAVFCDSGIVRPICTGILGVSSLLRVQEVTSSEFLVFLVIIISIIVISGS